MSSVPHSATTTSSKAAPASTPAYDRLAQVAMQIADYARIAASLPTLDPMEAPIMIVTTQRTLTADLDAAILDLAEAIVREVR